jgi:hypothetical protein
MKLLVPSAVVAFFLLLMAPPSAPVHAQSNGASGKASQSDLGGRAAKTASTSKKQ